jgi:hypothetical protein
VRRRESKTRKADTSSDDSPYFRARRRAVVSARPRGDETLLGLHCLFSRVSFLAVSVEGRLVRLPLRPTYY